MNTDFYSKGSRIDSRCKSCCLTKKSARYYRGRKKRLNAKEIELGAKEYRRQHGFPRLESYEECPVIVDVIHAPTLKTSSKSDHVIIFQKETTAIEEIVEAVASKPNRIPRALKKLAIKNVPEDDAIPDFQGHSVPYGWILKEKSLVPHRGEQWILQRIEADLNAKTSSGSIAIFLNSARVKPRYAKVWIPQMIELVAKENKEIRQFMNQLV